LLPFFEIEGHVPVGNDHKLCGRGAGDVSGNLAHASQPARISIRARRHFLFLLFIGPLFISSNLVEEFAPLRQGLPFPPQGWVYQLIRIHPSEKQTRADSVKTYEQNSEDLDRPRTACPCLSSHRALLCGVCPC